MRSALNVAYPEEIKAHFQRNFQSDRRKLGSKSEAGFFLMNWIERNSKCNFLDHAGHDAEGNFVSEPYASTCKICLEAGPALAARLGVKYTLTLPSWHCPWSQDCVRMTFYKPQ
jgi:hypothetical protein